MDGASYIVRSLAAEGVDQVFMVPGGMNDPFMPAMSDTPGVRPIVAAHEGGAAYMADGYARASRHFGVAFGIASRTRAAPASMTSRCCGPSRPRDHVAADEEFPPAVQRTLADAVGDAGVVELVALCGLYALMGYMTTAFAIEPEPGLLG